MAPQKKHFGELIRETRMAKKLTWRRFAELVDLSPTYISQIEQGNFTPPTVDRVRKMAELLGADADELMASAGRMAEEVAEIIQKRPVEMASLLRAVQGYTPEQLRKMNEYARKINQPPSSTNTPNPPAKD